MIGGRFKSFEKILLKKGFVRQEMDKYGATPFKHVNNVFNDYVISIYTNDKNRLSLTAIENGSYQVDDNTLQLDVETEEELLTLLKFINI